MERKWTPGPWVPAYWSGEINGGESGAKPVIDMNTDTFDRVTACVQMDEEELANFNLIAAAPDLYEALEELAEKMAANMDDETVRVVASALRKARGEA